MKSAPRSVRTSPLSVTQRGSSLSAPGWFKPSIRRSGSRRHRSLECVGHSTLEQYLQATGRLMLCAQRDQLGVAAETRTQRGARAANFAFQRGLATVEPQIGLPIELELEVVSQCA